MSAAKPVALIRAEGNPGCLTRLEIETRAAREPHVEVGDLTPPEYLSDGQRARFERLAGILGGAGIMTEADADCLGRYLIAHDQYVSYSQTAEALADRGEIDKASRLVGFADKAFSQAQRAADSLGMTVTSRARMAIPKGLTKEDDL